MNIFSLNTSFKVVSIAALALLAGSAANVQDAAASPYGYGYGNANTINRIINQISPGGWGYKGGHSYGTHTYDTAYDTPYAYDTSYTDLDSTIYNRTMDLGVFFAPASSRITLRGKEVLDSLGYALASTSFAHSVYRIAGHTDASGNAHANRLLSKKRAYAVKKYLQHRFHIDPRRLVAVGFGEDRLKDQANPYSAINRRVEVTLIAYSYADLSSDSYNSAR